MSGEFAFIDSLRQLAVHPGARNLDDDCAVLKVGEETLVITHDMMVEGIHYLPGQDPADVAWKLVTVNLSDLASKGARPLGVLLGYMFGMDDARFVEGLHEALDHYGASLLGGDTVAGTGTQALGLTAIGKASYVPVPSRGTARSGDALYVTGPLGAAMLGFEALKAGSGDSLAFRRPHARLDEGIALAPHVSAIMDISDGLLLDALRLANASDVTLAIDSAAVPIAAPEDRRDEALRWGDDYELLFTAPAGISLPIPATQIGTAAPRADAPVLLDNQRLTNADELGFRH
ncbi:MAG: thiamine-phosphate kinase [Sphingomonadaceae bacterium]|nr:thiamine-phosphate kinase [Sphingomonadaceae bacterium]